MNTLRTVLAQGPLALRIVAAVLGGYVVAALASVAVLAFPIERTQAALAGMLASFAVYAAAVIWVFAARSAGRAWGGLLLTSLLLAPVAWWALQSGVTA